MERSKYYTLLGFKTVDVKPSIEHALQDEIVLQHRLDRLCLWVPIPHRYRALVWKVSLQVLPFEKKAWAYFSNVRREQFELLKSALGAIRQLPLQDQELNPEMMVDMMMMEMNVGSPIHIQRSFCHPRPVHLLSIAKAFLDICDDLEEEDAFWLFCMYIKKCQVSLKDPKPELYDFESLMLSHCPEVLKCMKQLGVEYDFLYPWFHCHFSSVFSTQVLEGVWDIIVGGALGILPYMAVALLINCSKKLLNCKSSSDFYNIVHQIERHVDLYAAGQLAIDLWEKPVLAQMTFSERQLLGYK